MIVGISFVKLILWLLLVVVAMKIITISSDTHKHYDSYSDGVEEAYISGRLRPRR